MSRRPRTYDAGVISGLRRAIMIMLGEKCEHCSTRDRRVLHIDHRNGGGTQHRKRVGTGVGYYRNILRDPSFPKAYRLLCANHHMLATLCGHRRVAE